MENLIQGNVPIGKIIDQYKIENINIYQEEIMANHLQIESEDEILGKIYTINREEQPLFLIAEVFPLKN
ncbi:hypothetical protein ACQKN7_25365 [Bacillus cereus]|uniref:hypothetical protein n=1 Tax=Bacillus cereus TaxID=1396 RepID=UPI003CFF76D7